MRMSGDDEYDAWLQSWQSAYPGDLPEVRVRHHARLHPPEPGMVPIDISVTAWGEAVSLWATPRDAALAFGRHGSGASFADTRAGAPIRSVVTVGGAVTVIREHRITFPEIQAFTDGQVLLVGSRARWTDQGGEHNALIIDHDGSVVAEACIGDGIEHVYTDVNDRVWVGYFDEGIFGNNGWGEPGREPPIGAPGLVRFGRDLSIDWQFSESGVGGGHFFADCYTLNVGANSTWTCYYDDFPVVRIADDQASVVAKFRFAIDTLLGDDTTTVGIGHYGAPDLVRTLRLSDGEELPPLLLAGPDGGPLTPHRPQPDARTAARPTLQCHARDGDLHVFIGTDWYRTDLDAIRATRRAA
jgi:hypothetical protein